MPAVAELVPEGAYVPRPHAEAADAPLAPSRIRHEVAPDTALRRLRAGEKGEQRRGGLANRGRRTGSSDIALGVHPLQSGESSDLEAASRMFESHAVEDDPEDSGEWFG